MRPNEILLPLFITLILLLTACNFTDSSQELSPANSAVEFRAESYRWNDHRSPYTFTFNNHFDTHQQTQEIGKNGLTGFFYITIFDEDNGIPVADHGDCEENPEGCTVGWTLQGIRMQAKLLEKGMGQHPQWFIPAENMPRQPGYTHFHWIAEDNEELIVGEIYDGYLLKLTAREKFFFEHHGTFLVEPGIDYETHFNVHNEE